MNALRLSAAALVVALVATVGACDARSAKPAPQASPAAATTASPAGSVAAAKTPGAPAAFPAADVERARVAASAGRLDVAADALAEALRKVEAAGPLRIEALQIVQDPVRGYGLYAPIENRTVAPGQPLLIYFEPMGFGYRPVGPAFEIDLSADLRLTTPDGKVLQDDPNMLTSSVTSRRQNREVQFVLRLQTKGMPEGKFVADVTLHDRAGNKTAKASVPFELRIP